LDYDDKYELVLPEGIVRHDIERLTGTVRLRAA
jgi:hypothetical protein